MHQPYTYLIRFIPTGQFYYGAKTAKGCHPDDLWVKYFTSSKIVKKLIKEYGKDSFEIISIKLHENKEDALVWEEIYLISVNVGYNEEYLNRHNGGKNFTMAGMQHSEETKAKWDRSGENNPNYNNKISEETKKLMSANHRDCSGENNPFFGKTHSEEWKKEHSERMSGENHPNISGKNHPNYGKIGKDVKWSKKYIITFPDGHEEIIIGLKQFCKEHKLDAGCITRVAQGKRKHHHNFKCKYFIEE